MFGPGPNGAPAVIGSSGRWVGAVNDKGFGARAAREAETSDGDAPIGTADWLAICSVALPYVCPLAAALATLAAGFCKSNRLAISATHLR